MSARQAQHVIHGLLADLAPDLVEELAKAYRAEAEGDTATEEDALREVGGAVARMLGDIREAVMLSADEDREREAARRRHVETMAPRAITTSGMLALEMARNDR